MEANKTPLPPDCQLKMFIFLTGACGLMLKAHEVEIFCGNESVVDEEGNELSIWCMPCTSAANCGVPANDAQNATDTGRAPNGRILSRRSAE